MIVVFGLTKYSNYKFDIMSYNVFAQNEGRFDHVIFGR